MVDTLHIADEFPQDPDLIYLNHAAVPPWPARTGQAITAFSEENVQRGAQHYLRWVDTEAHLRKQLQLLINAPSVDDIALLKNTSEALSVVAHGIEWRNGDNIVVPQQEFPSNRVVWESLRKFGVEVRLVDIANSADPETVLLQQTDRHTRLLTVSSVQYATGLRMDLQRLGEQCKQHQIYFCVDAIQSVGALQFDVQAINADFIMADGHKWMLGPEGLALFYCRAECRDQLNLHQYGWHMLESMLDYTALEWSVAQSARRFECGSPNMLGIHALSASLSLLLDVGMAEVEQQVLERTGYMLELIQHTPSLQLISRDEPQRRSGILTFSHQHVPSQRLYETLMAQKVICANRGGGIRFSPHFYTEYDKIKSAVQLSALTA